MPGDSPYCERELARNSWPVHRGMAHGEPLETVDMRSGEQPKGLKAEWRKHRSGNKNADALEKNPLVYSALERPASARRSELARECGAKEYFSWYVSDRSSRGVMRR